MGKLTIDYSLPYCDGAYMLKALPQPEPQREPENEMDALYIKAMRDLSEGRIEEGLNGLKAAYGMGDLETGIVLAYGYGQGWFGEKDYKQELRITREIARKNHSKAMRNYAFMLRYGAGVRKDVYRALFWLRAAADRGDAVAMAGVAQMLAFGDEIEHDYDLARAYVLKAVDRGEPSGANTLAKMFEKGVGFDKNPDKAFTWYNLAYEREENPVYAANLSRCYRKGIGTEIDLEKADELLKDAKEAGW